MSIIYLRKVLMQEFNFCYIKNKYGNKSKLLFTDIHEGFSSYSAWSKYYYDENNLVIGKMKDEIVA